MLVTFDPFINTGASADAAYVNFLRCVTAICTAAAGTSSLTVNPYTNNTGTTDATKNCIVSIDANTEAGGWTTSASHNVPASATFSAMSTFTSTPFASQWKADFYNTSGKGTYPYNKLCFHTVGHNSSALSDPTGLYVNTTPISNWPGYGSVIMMTFGCNTVSDLSAGGFVPTWSGITPNQQTTSWTLNGNFGNYTTSTAYPFPRPSFNFQSMTNFYYRIAVTANYCIIWEVHRSNSYATGYNNTSSSCLVGASGSSSYGSIMYGGLRDTQAWENGLGYNPPWVAFHVIHIPETSPSYSVPTPPNSAAAFMATISDSGVTSATASKYALLNYSSTSTYYDTVNGGYSWNAYGSAGSTNTGVKTELVAPIYYQRQISRPGTSGNLTGYHHNLPTVDPNTGTMVPSAYPIMFRRNASGTWNPGGFARGIYKSVTAPLSTMKLYWADGQTFTIGTDTYIPVVFNEDMYLIRKA